MRYDLLGLPLLGQRSEPIKVKKFGCLAARGGRPIIVEWERRKAFGGPLSFGDSSLRYRALHLFISDSQSQPNLRRCHVKNLAEWKYRLTSPARRGAAGAVGVRRDFDGGAVAGAGAGDRGGRPQVANVGYPCSP
ncbi:hypothetical protein EVAR_87333_1 [Eumeta japonica]|uniref:Uncharacterized protein n=1 Tax=Eumeta variegata TaxID=151549 RepID=A0A4C1YSX5_EUMVA|nr:hypothetical protein EVAR_87333_1 [Eumeta japonica]